MIDYDLKKDWVNVKDQFPKDGINVLASFKNSHGKRRLIKAFYAHKHGIEANADDECEIEWDENEQHCYLKEGWYECIENWGDFSSIVVSEGTVDYWMSAPSMEGLE